MVLLNILHDGNNNASIDPYQSTRIHLAPAESVLYCKRNLLLRCVLPLLGNSSVAIVPLTFVNIYGASDVLFKSSTGADLTGLRRSLSKYVIYPLRIHLTTSAFGVFQDRLLIAWICTYGVRRGLIIEQVGVKDGYQNQGLEQSLFLFAYQQANILKRLWLAAKVPTEDHGLLSLYTTHGLTTDVKVPAAAKKHQPRNGLLLVKMLETDATETKDAK